MQNGIFQSSTIPILEEVVRFAQARHDVLVGNVANLDTPGYRVRDLSTEDFQQSLREALDARQPSREPLSPGLYQASAGDPLRDVRDSIKSVLYHDGSDVGIEQQVLEISKNQFLHNLAISIMSSQFQLLQTAVSERV